MTGAELIVAERQRQIEQENWSAGHDDAHQHGELRDAASCYLLDAGVHPTGDPGGWWPWDDAWWKPSDDPVRNLVKAGALLAAEIDRISRMRRQ